MPDITTIRGDSTVIATPIFDTDRERYRSETELNSITDIEYLVADTASGDNIRITKTLSDAAVTVKSVSDIDSVKFDGFEDTVGIIEVQLSATETESLSTDTLWHEMQIIDGNGNTATVMRGDFEVLESATNPRN